VQPWCNQGGKDGNYGRNGQIAVNSIERMDTVFPQIQDGQSSRTIRSQTLYPLSYGCVWEDFIFLEEIYKEKPQPGYLFPSHNRCFPLSRPTIGNVLMVEQPQEQCTCFRLSLRLFYSTFWTTWLSIAVTVRIGHI
jgi:hypothetical protein